MGNIRVRTSHVADEEVSDLVLPRGQESAAVPKDKGLAAQRDGVGKREHQRPPPRLLVRLHDVVVEQRLVAVADGVLEGEGGDGAEGGDGLGGELGRLGEHVGVHLLELELVLEAQVPGREPDGHRDAQGDEGELPAVGEGYGYRADEGEESGRTYVSNITIDMTRGQGGTHELKTMAMLIPRSSSNCFGSLPTRAVNEPVEFCCSSKNEVFW